MPAAASGFPAYIQDPPRLEDERHRGLPEADHGEDDALVGLADALDDRRGREQAAHGGEHEEQRAGGEPADPGQVGAPCGALDDGIARRGHLVVAAAHHQQRDRARDRRRAARPGRTPTASRRSRQRKPAMNGPAARPRLQANVYSAADTCRLRRTPVGHVFREDQVGGEEHPRRDAEDGHDREDGREGGDEHERRAGDHDERAPGDRHGRRGYAPRQPAGRERREHVAEAPDGEDGTHDHGVRAALRHAHRGDEEERPHEQVDERRGQVQEEEHGPVCSRVPGQGQGLALAYQWFSTTSAEPNSRSDSRISIHRPSSRRTRPVKNPYAFSRLIRRITKFVPPRSMQTGLKVSSTRPSSSVKVHAFIGSARSKV